MLAPSSNSQRPQRYALCIFAQVMLRKELETKNRALRKGACPSSFPWRTLPRKRHPRTLRTTEAPCCKKRHLGESLWRKNLDLHKKIELQNEDLKLAFI